MGEDDPQVGEVGGDVVDAHRVRVLQPHAAAARHAGADPGCPGVEQGDQSGFGDDLVEGIEVPVVGPERLGVGVELESAHAGVDQLARHSDPELALVGVDRPEREEHVGVGAGGLEDLGVAEVLAAHPRLVVDVEDDREHVPLAVVVGDFPRARLWRAPPKYRAAASRISVVTGSWGSEWLRSA